MSEPERVSYKEVVADKKERIEAEMSTLWEVHDSITITDTLCEKASCGDCPAREVCRRHIDKAINHIKDAIVELACSRHDIGIISAELTGEEWIVEQEVRC